MIHYKLGAGMSKESMMQSQNRQSPPVGGDEETFTRMARIMTEAEEGRREENKESERRKEYERNLAKIARVMLEDEQRESDRMREAEDSAMKIEAMHKELEAERSRYQVLESQKKAEADLFSQIKDLTASQLSEANESIKMLTKEMESMKIGSGASAALQKTSAKGMESKLSEALGKLAQAEKQNKELMGMSKNMPSSAQGMMRMPSFEFTPVKDRDGKFIKLIATPTGT